MNPNSRLRIALTKGRLQDKSLELFETLGLDCGPVRSPGRRLVHPLPNYPLDAVLANAAAQSERKGIAMELEIALQEELAVDHLQRCGASPAYDRNFHPL